MRFAIASSVLLAAFASCSSPTKTTALPPIESPPAAEKSPAEVLVEDLAALRWKKLGHPVVRWDAVAPLKASREKPHRLLVVLVEFADYRFERFRGEAKQGEKLAAFYQEQLFDREYKRENSLSHYYAEQSRGAYHVDGLVLPPVRLKKRRGAYGRANRPAGGNWRDDVAPKELVKDAIEQATKSVSLPQSEFDQWDPSDFDGDGITDEPDGYLDHFVLVYAGAPQNVCQSTEKIGETLNANVGNEAIASLSKSQLECVDRLWPHRSIANMREGEGPLVAGGKHPRGGVTITDSMWVYDYNMQSEYTEESTFIHEFGHSLGLSDMYSRTSRNSVGAWAVMASDMRPDPQSMSSWERIQLGWLKPTVVVPPAFGGEASGTIQLAMLDDNAAAAERTLMVVLPPKKKMLALADALPPESKMALYGGQGNELNRTAETTIDLSKASSATLSFDAWWEIEGGWDFAYLEVSVDDGRTWTRQVPDDRRHMPAKHGHDGTKTLPGFTGVSGDLDGDGKNESNTACDPKLEVKEGEDKANAAANPCLVPSWVRPSFDFGAYAGKPSVRVRLRHYTDIALVMRGILVDNLTLATVDASGKAGQTSWTFESNMADWILDGWAQSTGRHEILVPHYYLLEYRDPYASISYDANLANTSLSFYANPETGEMTAAEFRRRPGVVLWYADGTYAWSENDPAINGPGKGYALVVDSNPNEIKLPGLEAYFRGSSSAFDSHYDISGADAQAKLKESFNKTVCFVRTKSSFPRDLDTDCKRRAKRPPLASVVIDGKTATYGYEVLSSVLPGAARAKKRKVYEFLDTRRKKGVVSYRLRDRALRAYHTMDAPFSARPFDDGIVLYRVGKTALEKVGSLAHPAEATFNDETRARWLNPKLPFGGAAISRHGFSFEVSELPATGTAGEVVEIRFRWGADAKR